MIKIVFFIFYFAIPVYGKSGMLINDIRDVDGGDFLTSIVVFAQSTSTKRRGKRGQIFERTQVLPAPEVWCRSGFHCFRAMRQETETQKSTPNLPE
jgi:hypothetical protein